MNPPDPLSTDLCRNADGVDSTGPARSTYP